MNKLIAIQEANWYGMIITNPVIETKDSPLVVPSYIYEKIANRFIYDNFHQVSLTFTKSPLETSNSILVDIHLQNRTIQKEISLVFNIKKYMEAQHNILRLVHKVDPALNRNDFMDWILDI